MKKLLKMSLIWILILAMASSLMTGCSGNTTDDNSSDGDSTDVSDDYGNDDGDDVWVPTVSGDSQGGTQSGTVGGNSGTLSGATSTNDFWSQVPKDIKGDTIRIMTWWDMSENEKKTIETWEKNTGTTVKIDKIADSTEYYNKLAARITAGGNKVPNVAALMIQSGYIQAVANNMFQPISKGDFNLKDPMYDLEAMKCFKRNGETLGVMVKGSLQSHYIVVRYNKTMFKQKGMKDTPYSLWKAGNWNWDTFLDLAKQMTTKDVYGVAYYNSEFWATVAGGDFVKLTDNGFELDYSDGLKKGFKFSWDLMNSYKVAPSGVPSLAEFVSGKYAMWVQESYCLQKDLAENKNSNYEFGCAPIPAPKGQSYVTPLNGSAWGFPKKAKDLDAASWFIRYWMDETFYSEKSLENDEAYEVTNWMAEQPKQIFLGRSVYSYGGQYDFTTFESGLRNCENNALYQTIDSAKSVFESNIEQLMEIYRAS